jgi:hypothetical protein
VDLQRADRDEVANGTNGKIMVQRTATLRTFGYVHAANTFYVIDADGTNQARRIHAPESAAEAALLPDGEMRAFVSGDFADTTTGVIDIYVTDADGTDEIPTTGSNSKQEDPDLDVVRTRPRKSGLVVRRQEDSLHKLFAREHRHLLLNRAGERTC